MAAPGGPVFVSVPTEYLMRDRGRRAPAAAALPRPAEVAPAVIDEIAQVAVPCEASGDRHRRGRQGSRGGESLVALAESLGAPVLEAWQPYYVNFPRTHPLYGGIVHEEARRPFAGGRDLPRRGGGAVAPAVPAPRDGTRVLVLGEDPLHSRLPFWGFRADLVAAGEVGPSLERLVDRVGDRAAPLRAAHSRNGASGTIANAQCGARPREPRTGPALETGWIAHELSEVLPDDAILVDETITHRLDMYGCTSGRGCAGSFFEASYGGLGVGLGLALGVKHAQPQAPVVCTIGDGAFHYNPVVGSFGAAQEHRLPILVVLFDNAGYLSQKGDVAMYYPGGAAVQTGRFAGTSIAPRPDYVMLARAFGGSGEKVERPADVRPALQRGLETVASGRLALVHMVLAPV